MTIATDLTWCMPWGQLAWLRQLDDRVARRFFDASTSFVVGNTAVPGYACSVLPVFYSWEPYANSGAVMTGTSYPWVCYDPENWPKTHPKVKADPRAALWHFVIMARARGQKVVAAPSRDLIYAPGSAAPWQAPEDINQGYLRCQVPAAAEDADVLVVQNQGAEKDPETYARLLIGADKQSPASQVLWGELTTNFATAAQMRAAYDAAAGCGVPVLGYWVTIATQPQAQVAVDFFRGLM